METKLARIAELSTQNPNMVFTSLGHLINEDLLKACHDKMDGTKAVGIDGMTKEEYTKNLDENLQRLVYKLKTRSYRPQPARRVEIPKDNGKMRPLSIYCYEDKLIQEALKRILEAVFEPHFYNEMMGFRPNRNCHMALKHLNHMIEKEKTNYILDADIKGFFDHINHDWAIKFIESKNKRPQHNTPAQEVIKSWNPKRFSLRRYRGRQWSRLSLFPDNSQHLYALCITVVVS